MNNIYLGYLHGGAGKEVFRSNSEPTAASHGEQYAYVVGPFRTVRAAKWMAHPVRGTGNPHCRCVADAERLALKYRDDYDHRKQEWRDPTPPYFTKVALGSTI